MISHKHECVFVHIPKAAGQSVEMFFLQDLGLGWNERAPLLLRPKIETDPKSVPDRLAHLTAEEYISFKYLSSTLFEYYFSFSIARNPFSRVVSFYKYLGYQDSCSFSSFVTNHLEKAMNHPKWAYFFRPQSDFTHDKEGRQIVNFVGKLETIEQDFRYVASHLGFENDSLPHVNSSASGKSAWRFLKDPRKVKNLFATKKGSSWEDYYDDRSERIVHQLYSSDFFLFGYVGRIT